MGTLYDAIDGTLRAFRIDGLPALRWTENIDDRP